MAAPVSAPVALGRFVWLELATTDPDAAIGFYTKVTGWTTTPWQGQIPYTVLNSARGPIGGVMAITPDMKARGVAPHWISYVSTPDVDATLKQVTALGGKVLVPGTDIPNVGRFGVFKDPQGAAMALLTPQGDQPSREGTPQSGEVCWNELATTDASAAFDFYHKLFEWEKTSAMEMGPGNIYQMYGRAGQSYGGMYKADAKQGPPSWVAYVEIPSVADAAKRIPQLGGKVLNGPMDVPGGQIVQAVDPQGAYFALHTEKKG
jgi:predicted enzyme related to lactoylglutathione lyase